LIHDHCRAGLFAEAIDVFAAQTKRCVKDRKAQIDGDLPNQSWGTRPIQSYTAGWLHYRLENNEAARRIFLNASTSRPDYCFPSRLEEIAILETAMRVCPADPVAAYLLGNLLYDRRRHREAIKLWEHSARIDPHYSVVRRNLGIGYFNILKQPARARAAYHRAFEQNPDDARLLYERDQLWKRLGDSPAKRLRELEQHPDLVQQRDDLSIEQCALYNQTGQPAKALEMVSHRKFQPWEGGEGGPLGQWVRSHLALGRAALGQSGIRKSKSSIKQSLLTSAASHFEAALTAPHILGEARHLLANQSDVHYWLGCALSELGETTKAREHWRRAATFKGDFQSMSVRAFSEMTYYSALSWKKLGQRARATKLLRELLAYAKQLQKTKAKVDYFATSLPTMLLFEDDLQFRQVTTALFLEGQAHLALGNRAKGRALLKRVLRRDPNHPLAADLLDGLQSVKRA
jgi:tetratricopeptide (TPR) repeat protein